MNRRDFLGIAASAALTAAGTRSVERAGWRLQVDANENILSLRKGSLELVARGARENRPKVSGPATLEYAINFLDLGRGAVAVKQMVTTSGRPGTRATISVELPRPIRLPSARRAVFLPLFEGVGWHGPAQPGLECAYVLAGEHGMRNPRKLAMPLIDESSPEGSPRIAYCTDAFFSTGIDDAFHWIYSDKVPPPEHDKRTVFTVVHAGDEREALRLFYRTAVESVRPGPDWLHDVAMVDYDYFSDNGRGWFRDIDTLTEVIPRSDRHKVLFVLHGWYGYIGRYTYNQRTRSLAKRWVAFPEARSPGVQALAEKYNPANPYSWRPDCIRALRPVAMSIEEMHRRIRYGKERGFRVLLYYGDGVAACDGLKDIYSPSKVLRWGGWTLPGTLGKYYVQNPLHPEVTAFFKGYMQALLAEYGRDVDGFVWDETFLVTSKDLGNAEYPGYASRTMMRLVQTLSMMVQEYRPGLAFLSSDDLGLADHDCAYSLVAHGTYQDSAMAPRAWDFGLFPNYPNVIWSCNWAPIKLLKRTQYAVATFDVPVSISNGYGEDLGISEMTPAQLKSVMDLFNRRKSRRMEITWIEEKNGELTYKGRPINPRPA